MSETDFLRLGDWNAICWRCGRKFKASTMLKNWQGFWTCRRDWEPRQPQDFVKGVEDHQTPPWVQPPQADNFVAFCTPDGISAIADLAVADCAIADYVHPAAIGLLVNSSVVVPSGYADSYADGYA